MYFLKNFVCVFLALAFNVVVLFQNGLTQESKPAVSYREFKAADRSTWSEKKRLKDEALKGTWNKDAVKDYYVGICLPLMTTKDSYEQNNLARTLIFQDIEKAEGLSEATYNEFATLLIPMFASVASRDDFHPAAAINAVHILNRFNKSKAKGNAAAEPHPRAVEILSKLIVEGKNDGVRAAALSGLERAITVSGPTWNDTDRRNYSTSLVTLLKSAKPPLRSNRADGWLRGRALELLSKFKHPSENEVYQLALTSLADTNSDPILVEKAMAYLGTFPVIPNLQAEETKKALVQSLNYYRVNLLAWQENLRARQPAAMGAYSGGETSDMSDAGSGDAGADTSESSGGQASKKKQPKENPFAKQSQDIKLLRRMLHELLEKVRYGFTGTRWGDIPAAPKLGIATLVPPGESATIMKDIMNELKTLQEAINRPGTNDRAALDQDTQSIIQSTIRDIDDFLAILGVDTSQDKENAELAPATPMPENKAEDQFSFQN